MRSRYQGACFDRHIHLFMYNIINYCFKVMRTCNTHNLIKGGHGRPPLFPYKYPYQKSIPLSSIFASTLSSITATNDIMQSPARKAIKAPRKNKYSLYATA